MPDAAGSAPFVLVWGDDDFAVQRRARGIFDQWLAANPGGDEEILDAAAANSEEALKALRRLREALQTLPFFGGTKSIWFRACNFIGEDRVSDVQAVVEAVTDLAKDLGSFRWNGVRLLLSAGKIDRRRGFYRTVEKLAEVEHFPGLSGEDRDWRDKAETMAAGELRALGRRPDGEALAALVEQVGPNARQLSAEVQKLAAYVGDRESVRVSDVDAIVTRGRHARAFALADALGERQLAKALRHLDEELWSMHSDRQKSEIGLLYALIGKVRAMLLVKEMIREGMVRLVPDYRAFAAQLKNLPADRFPTDRRYNPADINAFVLFRAAQHAANFSRDELVKAMDELLRCNRQLVGGSQDGGFVLQFALTRILVEAGDRLMPIDDGSNLSRNSPPMKTPPGTTFPAFAAGDLAWVGVIGPGICKESGRFETVLDQVVLRGYSTLIIDLSSCPRMDSTFVGVLLRLAQGSSIPDGSGPRLRIILNRSTEQVRELLDTLCLDQYFEMADMAVSDGMDQLPLEDRDLSKEEIMALSLDGHERLAAVNAGNAARFANLLSVLRKQLESAAPSRAGGAV